MGVAQYSSNPLLHNGAMKLNDQLPLNLTSDSKRPFTRTPEFRRRQMTRARAAFWFDQMRRSVDAAPDFPPSPCRRGIEGEDPGCQSTSEPTSKTQNPKWKPSSMKNKTIGGNLAASRKTTTSSPVVSHKTNQNTAVPSHGNGSPCEKTNTNAPKPHNPHHGKVPSTGKSQLEFEYIPSDPEHIEPLVTRETVCKHYQIGMRTLTYAMSLGLPSVAIGRARRFRFSEVQPWFEKNGYRRIASEGRKLAIQKALIKTKQFHLALTQDVQVTNEKNKIQNQKDKKRNIQC